MQALVEQAGTLESLYRGDWKKSKRHGFGIQLFPNGARFIGTWKKGMAEGFGRLEFTDGTFYEGNFSKNRIVWGKLVYFNGTYFEGSFDGVNDLFKSGKIMFRDGESFHGTWDPDGIVLSGALHLENGQKAHLQSENIVRESLPGVSGKIIYWKKGLVYEGGLKRGNYDQKGFVYGNIRHPFYYECNYKHGKNNGRYLYNSLFYGFSTLEFFVNGKEVGTWRYMTSRGYEYTADTSTKNQAVSFPFLNKDYYEGEIDMWCHKIVLTLGIYFQLEDPANTYKQIRVINCDNITAWKNIRQRSYAFDKVSELITRRHRDMKRSHFSSEAGVCLLEDGTIFRGAVVGDYIVCHRKDLVKMMDQRCLGLPGSISIQPPVNYYTNPYFNPDAFSVSSAQFFRGTILNGQKTGFCHVINAKGDEFRGFYTDDKKTGFGFYSRNGAFTYIGNFKEDEINGQGTMMVHEKEMLKGEFINGLLAGLGYIKYFHSNIEFFGQVQNNSRNGKGVLKFQNNYKFEGTFRDDEIDTSAENGRLINKEEEMVEEGTFLPSKDQGIGLLQTVDGKFYVMDFKHGVVRKTS
jgi:hypothetical protein